MKGTSLTGRGRKMCLADENTTVCFGWGLFTNEHIRGYFSSHFGPIPILRLQCKEYLNTRVEVVPRRLLCMSTFLVERFRDSFHVFVIRSLNKYNSPIYPSEENFRMPKKKTGQRKKAEKQKLRQKEIRSGVIAKPLADWACNSNMVRFFFNLDTVYHFPFTEYRNAIDVIWSKSYELSATFVPHFKDYRCVVIVVKSNACSKQEIVLSNMVAYLQQDWAWW